MLEYTHVYLILYYRGFVQLGGFANFQCLDTGIDWYHCGICRGLCAYINSRIFTNCFLSLDVTGAMWVGLLITLGLIMPVTSLDMGYSNMKYVLVGFGNYASVSTSGKTFLLTF